MDIKSTYLHEIAFIVILLLTGAFQSTYCVAAKMPKPVVVYMYDKYFEPATLTIAAGQKVTWINKGKLDHTVTSKEGYFDSGHIAPGSSISYTFTKPGTFSYVCTMHSLLFFGMRGKIIVK